MLRLALEQEEGGDRPVGELVSDVLATRSVLSEFAAASGTGLRGPADRIGDSLAYDAALVRLCERLGIDHQLTSDTAGPAARPFAERRLAERLPSIAAALEGTGPGFTVSEP